MNPYRSSIVSVKDEYNPTSGLSLWAKFLDRLIGYTCTCPTCNGRKRPRIILPILRGDHHWWDIIPYCLFGSHKQKQYIEIDEFPFQYIECLKCGIRLDKRK